MERYTKRLPNGVASWNYTADCYGEYETKNKVFKSVHRQNACERLAAYEDTGLEPDEIDRILDAYGRGMTLRTENAQRLKIVKGIQTDRLRELAQADREGRCFVFRFGFGDTVYRIWVYPSGEPAFVTENRMETLNDLLNAETWDNAYKTRAEAESVLRREKDG